MYAAVLLLHSVIRWIVVALGTAAVYRAWRGRSGRVAWTSADARIAFSFAIALDLQLVLGLALFVRGPITILGLYELDLALRSPVLFFWTFVHPVLMAAAVVLAHLARVRIRRHAESSMRHRAALQLFGLALIAVLAGIPWPFLPYGRPLLSWLQ